MPLVVTTRVYHGNVNTVAQSAPLVVPMGAKALLSKQPKCLLCPIKAQR